MSSTKLDVQIDNPQVRVTRWTLATGEDTGEHLHEHDYVVVPMAAGTMRLITSDGAEETAEIRPGASYYRRAGARHTVRNTETGVLDFVEVEILASAAEPDRSL